MEGARNDLHLLVARELAEVHGVAAHTDGEVRVLLRVFHSVHKHLPVEHVDVDVVASLGKVAVQHCNQVVRCKAAAGQQAA